MAALGNKVVLFGGLTSEEFGDMWEWDGATWTNKTPVPKPSTRSNAAMAVYGNKLVLFGGVGDGQDVRRHVGVGRHDLDATDARHRPPARYARAHGRGGEQAGDVRRRVVDRERIR